MNKRQKGNQQRLKTKKWLEKQGWIVETSEVNKIAYFGGRLVAIHKDLFGSDLLCLNGKDILFVQCKTNKSDISSGIKEFQKYPFPKSVKRWVVLWEPRIKKPIIRAVENSA